MQEVWLTTAAFGTTEYFRRIGNSRIAWIEASESYEKQSWRNRYRILTANGPIDLTIPIVRGNTPGQPITEVRIDYSLRWQKVHQRAVESAYRHSPYFDFFVDDLAGFWNDREEFLFDYNLRIIHTVCKLFGLDTDIRITADFVPTGGYGTGDFRYSIHPKAKKQGTGFNPVPYHQVFSDRYGFVGGLSVIDLLFNDFRSGSQWLRQP